MHIKIYSTANEVEIGQLKDKNVIIIDVLRATSVIATALTNGAKKVMTTHSIDVALAQKAKNPYLILGGERNAERIKGFDFGNSPLEYTSDNIRNENILLCTSNGTQAVNKALGANILIAASFLNLDSIVKYLENVNEDFNIVCSGTNGNFSLDDGLCAGLILSELRKRITVSTNDLGELLVIPFEKDSFSLHELLNECFHFNFLKNNGFSVDVDYCLNINYIDLIPIWDADGFISLKT
ncbi:MAG: 2-phosphosulfolactate phosphatase [Bacteroidales bacterium]|jgi:2-phosphosulfolactate phosphatase|nr:2-phosphosulfolactate phosphatase [Bacteroidales bacterium]